MTGTNPVLVRRIYEAPEPDGGARVLVDRLWPRGMSKDRADLDRWVRDLAPSTELREWYQHVPERFPEFTTRYLAELEGPVQQDLLGQLRALLAVGPVTLLTATKDVEHSEAVVLAEVLRGQAPADPVASAADTSSV